VSLVASPSHVTLVGKARETMWITNSGADRVVVDVTRAGLALDLRGRPRIVPRWAGSRPAASWLRVRPSRLAIAPGGGKRLTVSSAPSRLAEPGDHQALVLLATRPHPRRGLAVRMRIGILVVVRVPGRIVRRVVPLALRVRRLGRVRVLELLVANRGNVTELLDRGCVIVTLRRRNRVLARLQPLQRRLLPRTRGIAEFRYRGPARGGVLALVEPAVRSPCPRGPPRAFPIRL
jgi:hypothetical protein